MTDQLPFSSSTQYPVWSCHFDFFELEFIASELSDGAFTRVTARRDHLVSRLPMMMTMRAPTIWNHGKAFNFYLSCGSMVFGVRRESARARTVIVMQCGARSLGEGDCEGLAIKRKIGLAVIDYLGLAYLSERVLRIDHTIDIAWPISRINELRRNDRVITSRRLCKTSDYGSLEEAHCRTWGDRKRGSVSVYDKLKERSYRKEPVLSRQLLDGKLYDAPSSLCRVEYRVMATTLRKADIKITADLFEAQKMMALHARLTSSVFAIAAGPPTGRHRKRTIGTEWAEVVAKCSELIRIRKVPSEGVRGVPTVSRRRGDYSTRVKSLQSNFLNVAAIGGLKYEDVNDLRALATELLVNWIDEECLHRVRAKSIEFR